MNGKKGSIQIDIPPVTKAKLSETTKKHEEKVSISCKNCVLSMWEFCKEDSNRVIFSLKVGLAVLLVSLLILCQTPYRVFGATIIWSILTVTIMFEYSGAVTSFMKLWPSVVLYEYGFWVILFTYCLIIVSGYQMGNPIRTAMDRLYSIAIGGIVAVVVNVLVFPIWAGEQLHKELVSSFASVADALEECVRKYLEDDGSGHLELTKTVMDDFPDEPALIRLNESHPMVYSSTSSIHGRNMSKLAQSCGIALMKLWQFIVCYTQKISHMAELDNKLLGQNPNPQSQPLDSYHETMRKQSRRLYSWPSRKVDAFEEEGCFSSDCIPRIRAFETTATLSLATFTSLLIKFVARLNHLVEVVNQLSKMAKFKQEAL
ncbi:UNVERIFIED_CONTAM: Aluminum-activated malate transporter 9 [Sesamum latifolium]|uniref:Aluminum-activated malate transporter 9 n=1 Tax=Sesamum latifolium TaxID=2727402 RepID=A0AAW2SM68_9LAMI